jgi:hypothetical protein
MSGRRSFLPFPSEVPGSAAGGGAAAGNAFANYAAIDRSAPPNTSPAPSDYVIAAIVLTPTTRGIFRVNVSLSGSDTLTEGVTLLLLGSKESVPGTPIVMIGGTAASQNGSTAGAASASNGGQIAAVAVTPISFTGNTAPLVLSTKIISAVTNTQFAVGTSGLFSLSTGGISKMPWPLNQTALICVAVTPANGAISSANLEFSAQEQPFV